MKLKQGERIVFIGDSVTDDGRARPIGEGGGNRTGNGFVHMVDTFLIVDHPTLRVRCINMGISGNTSADLVARWQTDVVDLNPDRVVMCIGFNDVWRQFDCPRETEIAPTPDAYRKNLEFMVENTKAPMLWMTPYYLEPNKKDAMRARMDEYGAIVKDVAAKHKIPVIDLQVAMDKLLEHHYPAEITWDRIHPGWIGSLVIAREILKYFEA